MLIGNIAVREQNQAVLKQNIASNPEGSAWVAASAGTGKTKVLTDRLLRLLLEGAAPESILCLTFTNAAAAEMRHRLLSRLQRFVVLPEVELVAELQGLLGRVPETQIQREARCLFAQMLDGGANLLKIQTIHSFCQSLLQRFTFESELPTGTTLLTDTDTPLLLREAKSVFFASLMEDSPLTQACHFLSGQLHEMTLTELLAEIIGVRSYFQSLFSTHSLEQVIAESGKQAGIAPEETSQQHLKAIIAGALEKTDLSHQWLEVTEGESKEALAMGYYLAAPEEEREKRIFDYIHAFLTLDCEPRKTLLTKKRREANPALHEALRDEQERIYGLVQRYHTVVMAHLTTAMITMAHGFLQGFTQLKREKSVMDYDDLIEQAGFLLGHADMRDWVRYKLDQAITHILVDEAQDTSPAQWKIIDHLAEEFFAGEGAVEEKRTLFVVGDFKQSIFSFQGAAPEMFHGMHGYFQQKSEVALCPWNSVELDTSFRSTEAVLSFVDHVFSRADIVEKLGAMTERLQHKVHRNNQPGKVVLWPLMAQAKKQPYPTWYVPKEPEAEMSVEKDLAYKMAAEIALWLEEKRYLPAKSRVVQPSDIMVLVRSRGAFIHHLIGRLQALKVPVSGVDRLSVSTHIAVQDLISLARFMALPEDDLSLAEVMRSPLLNMSEEQLLALAVERGELSLWQSLQHGQPEIARMLEEWRALLTEMSLSDWYRQLLYVHHKEVCFSAAMGEEVQEVLQVFLDLVDEYQYNNVDSLEGFLEWFDGSYKELKRDVDDVRANQVRVMTIHASKGLQAPIVFLTDTTELPREKGQLLWQDNGLPLFAGGKAAKAPFVSRLRLEQKEASYQEYLRLLYVAMTRAEDELYLVGGNRTGKAAAGSWYEHVLQAMEQLGKEYDDGLWEYHTHQLPPQVANQEVATKPTVIERPACFAEMAIPEIQQRRVAPSSAEEEFEDKRGIAIHLLLEKLPAIAVMERLEAGEALLGASFPSDDFSAELSQVLAFVSDPELAFLFAPGTQAEVPVMGEVDKVFYSGKIDRLIVSSDEVLVVDYKTHKYIPELVPESYQKQLLIYQKLVKKAFPELPVKAAILWFEERQLHYI